MEKSKTINSRKAKAIETKNKIYKTADKLFREYGFENVSVDSIVEMAGVSKGAFYVHFDSKDSLTAALFCEYAKELDLDYKSYIESIPSGTTTSDILISLAEKIAYVITCSIGYNHIKTLYKVQIIRTVNTDGILDYNRELYKIFSDVITKGVQQGEFNEDVPVDTLAKHFVLSIRGLTYEWCIRYPDFDLKEQARLHFQILLNGIIKNNK